MSFELRRLFAVFASVACAVAGPILAAGGAERLNVLVIVADDLGYHDLACYGSSFYDTPALDQLAKEGARFTQGYAACPVCSPTRAALMSGKYPPRFALTDFINLPGRNQPEGWKRNTKLLPAPYRDRLPHEEITLAEVFRDAGYKTFIAGKWHLGPEGYWPEDHGFQINIGGWSLGYPHSYFSPYRNPRLADGPEGEHLPMRLAGETCKFLEQLRDEPFFVYLPFYSVHIPQMATEELIAKYKRRRENHGPSEVNWGRERSSRVRKTQNNAKYAGMVEAMDSAVGDVLAKLDELDLVENTLVIFTSDNGGLSTAQGFPTSNWPLRGGKGWVYEGGIRVPWIFRWPGNAPRGVEVESPIITQDIYPTALAAAGLEIPAAQQVDGLNLVPLLRQTAELPDRDLYWHYPHYSDQGAEPMSAVRSGKWKLIERYEDGSRSLYNLRDDAGEQHDRAEAEPEVTAELVQRLNKWRTAVGARMPTENPNYKLNQ